MIHGKDLAPNTCYWFRVDAFRVAQKVEEICRGQKSKNVTVTKFDGCLKGIPNGSTIVFGGLPAMDLMVSLVTNRDGHHFCAMDSVVESVSDVCAIFVSPYGPDFCNLKNCYGKSFGDMIRATMIVEEDECTPAKIPKILTFDDGADQEVMKLSEELPNSPQGLKNYYRAIVPTLYTKYKTDGIPGLVEDLKAVVEFFDSSAEHRIKVMKQQEKAGNKIKQMIYFSSYGGTRTAVDLGYSVSEVLLAAFNKDMTLRPLLVREMILQDMKTNAHLYKNASFFEMIKRVDSFLLEKFADLTNVVV